MALHTENRLRPKLFGWLRGPILIAAVELLEQHTQARFNQVVLRLGLEQEISSSTSLSVAKKCDLLGRIVVQRAETVLDTLDGSMTLGEAVIRQTAQLAQRDSDHPSKQPLRAGLRATGMCSPGTTMGAMPPFGLLRLAKSSSPRPTTRFISSSNRSVLFSIRFHGDWLDRQTGAKPSSGKDSKIPYAIPLPSRGRG